MPRWIRWCRFREPVNGLTHLAGALLSVVGLAALVQAALARGTVVHTVALAVFGATLILMFTVSTLYHSLPLRPRGLERFQRFDHIAIYLLIAGTYTPVCLLVIGGWMGAALVAGVWGVALAGTAQKIWWMRAPEWFSLACYLAMGWAGGIVALSMLSLAPPAFWGWLAAGGLFYTIGAVIFGLDRPHLLPGVFGAHELWHLFVLAGSASHFWAIFRYVAVAA